MGNHLLTDQVLPDMNAAWIGSRDNSSRTILSLSASPQETQAAISADPDLPECLCTTADLLAAVLKLVIERIVRRRMADFLAVRQRPGTSEEGAILRGDVPKSGPSFPSGHVILVAAVGVVIAPGIAPVWWWGPLVVIGLVMVGRVYVGAHNPLDVTAGLGAGLLLGGVVAAFIG